MSYMRGRTYSSPPAKRQRTETADLTSDSENPVAASRPGKTQTLPANFNGDLSILPDFNPDAHKLSSVQISLLPATLTNSLLAYAAARDPYINSLVAHQFDLQTARKRARVINFSQYYEEASYLLNDKYAHFLGSQASVIAVDVVFDIVKMFSDILDIVTEPEGFFLSSYATKKNAFQTMTDIMMSVVTAPDVIGREARKVFCGASEMASDMEEKFLTMMTYFEGEELAQLHAEGLTDKIRELQLADRYSMYKRMDEVVEFLEGDFEESEEDSEEDGEEAGEEDEEVE